MRKKLEEVIKILNLNSDLSFDMQYLEDVDGNIIYVSPSCERITGYTPEEFLSISKLLESILLSEYKPLWTEHQELVKKKNANRIQLKIKHKEGSIIWIEHVCNKIYDEEGNFIGLRGSNRDITNGKLTDEIYNASPAVLFLWKNEEDWPVAFVSENIEKLSGYTREDFLNNKISYVDIVYSEDLERVSNEVVSFSEMKMEEFEHKPYRIKTKSGEIKWVEDKTNVKRDLNGKITYFQGSVVDVTGRVEAELKLKESEQWFSEIAEQSAECVSVATSDGDYVFVNSAFCKMMGYSKDELLAKTVFDMKKDKTEKAREGFTKSKLNSEGAIIEVELERKDKSTFMSEIVGKPIKVGNRNLVLGIVKDITERKKAEDALKESEELYRSVFEYSPLGIFHFSYSGVITDCNDKFAKIIGAPRDALIGFRMIEDLKDQKLANEIKKTLKAGSGFYEDYYTSVTSKKIIPIIVHFNAIYSPEGKIVSGMGLVEDVSERKEAEKAASEQSFIVENMNEFVYRQSSNGVFEYISPGITKILGFSPKEWETQHKSVFTNNPINQTAIKNTEDTLLKGINHPPYEVEVYNKYGDKVMLEVNESPVVKFGKVVGLIGIGHDITERKKSENLQKALYRISEEASKSNTINDFYKSLHQIIGTLMPAKNLYIAVHNTDENIIRFPYYADENDVSPTSRPFGKSLTEYVLKTKTSQIITETRDRELQKSGEIELSEEFTKIWIGIYLKFESNYKGVLVLQNYENENAYNDEDLKVLQFVSEQIVKTLNKTYADAKLRKYVKELFEAKEELEIINKNKDRFFSIISHDLRSPFMALMGISQMISEDMDSMSVGEVKEMTGAIYNSTQNLNKLIENLLNWSRLQMGTFEVSPQKINLKDISDSVTNTLKLSAKEKNITIEDNIKEVSLFADEDCAKTILRNLVNNAIKFTNRGGKIKISAKEDKDLVEIMVEDNGVGMTETTLKKLFIITEKVSEVGTEKEIGTGLGLILCKELVEKNNGQIWVESELGKGSRFTFALPTKAKIKNGRGKEKL